MQKTIGESKGGILLEYLNRYAQKAYREINAIFQNPRFLFSNDPELMKLEASANYCYIHGFNRLIKHNRITNERLLEALLFLEDNIEEYLKKHYKNKKFFYFLNGDALVPAFTLTVVSYHEGQEANESMNLGDLIEWYKKNACFDGIEIVEASKEDSEEEIVDDYPDSTRTYVKLIET